MKKRLNKKGQDLSISTLILIVLGIVVLVLLILGFSLGWSNLWEKIGIFGGTSSVGDVVTACSLAVTTGDNYGYFQDFKQIKVSGKTEYLNCQDLRVEQSLDNTLTNSPNGYGDRIQSAQTFCEILQNRPGGLAKETKINNGDPTGVNCLPSSASIDDEEE